MERDLDRVLELLWEKAEAGVVTAQRALLDHYRRAGEGGGESGGAEESVEAALYGDNVTPLRGRKSA